MPTIIWKHAPQDPPQVFHSLEETTKFANERGYCVRPDWGWVMFLTDEQTAQLKAML